GGALCFKGKGPERHALDPARRPEQAWGTETSGTHVGADVLVRPDDGNPAAPASLARPPGRGVRAYVVRGMGQGRNEPSAIQIAAARDGGRSNLTAGRMQPARGRGCPRHTYCGGRHRSYSFSAAEALRAAARTRYPSHPRTQRDPANRRGHRDRCTHYAHPNRAFRFSAATLLSAGGSRKNRRFAHPPQYGHNWRQYLFGHALSLVQPVAHLA